MEMQFSKDEYRLLLDMIYISEWVMNSHKVEEDVRVRPYKQVAQKILAYAQGVGLDNVVEHDKARGEYLPTEEFEEALASTSIIEDFEDDLFWDALCHRLAQRDLIREKGLKKVQKMDPVARMLEEDRIAEKYDSEFVANGIEHFILLKK
ncbi:MAG: hypothetical protein PHI06_02155 [Desulfobulbaceae bacterium]|nr:hypothetical protein [Desulfobulbaceae bacterium]